MSRPTKRFMPLQPLSFLVAAAAFSSACDAEVGTSFFALNIAAPDDTDTCLFSPEADGLFRSATYLNTRPLDQPASQMNLSLFARVANRLSLEPVTVDETVEWPPGTSAIPISFEYDWECDQGGYSFGIGSMFVPALSLDTPFCRNPFDEDADFVGTYSVAAGGTSIDPETTGLVEFEPLPPSLGANLDSSLSLAALAQQCCDDNGGCESVTIADTTSTEADNPCRALQAEFDRVSQGLYEAHELATLERFQPFSIYDGSVQTAQSEYPFRIRGHFSFIIGDQTATSNEFAHTIRVCRGCTRATSSCTR